MEMRTRSLHGATVGGGFGCSIRGKEVTRRPVKRSLQSPDVESRSFRPRSGQIRAPAVRKEIYYSNDVRRCHNHGNHVQSARAVVKG
jgi:hypothetical protein